VVLGLSVMRLRTWVSIKQEGFNFYPSLFFYLFFERFFMRRITYFLLMEYGLEELDLMNTHLKDSIVNLQVKLENGDLKDAEYEAKHLWERIKELNGNSSYAD